MKLSAVAEDPFRTMADCAPVLLWMAGTDARCTFFNKGWLDFTGRSMEEELGDGWAEGIHPEDFAGCIDEYMDAFRARASFRLEYRLRRHDGQYRWILDQGAPWFGADGRFAGYIGSCIDITDRRGMEAQLISRVRRAVEERDRMSAQLLQGQKLQAIGQLAAGIAHEINNPISYVLSNLSTIESYAAEIHRAARPPALSEQDTKDFEDAIRDTREGAERIAGIVQTLGGFSRRDDAELKETDINDAIEATLRVCWNELRYKATVHRDYGAIPPVQCFPQRIHQVFVNVLINAAQAIDERGTIFVSSRAEGEEAVIRIRDTGKGIPPEDLDKLFQPFFTTRPVGQGTGLGLHVSYNIVKAHGGSIEACSTVGEGSEFTIRLPLGGPRCAP